MQSPATDTLARRLRYGRQSTGRRITPTEADVLTFQVLDRHGPLPSTFIHEFTKHLRHSEGRTKERLGHLYHEDNTPHGGPYLDRPWQQWQTMNARYQPAVSENTALAEQVLTERGLLPAPAHTQGSVQFAHRFMVACITASIELAIKNDPTLRFIPQQEILERSPNQTLEIPCTIAYTNPRTGKRQTLEKPLMPDAIFGIEYEGSGFRFYMLEADRIHEPVRRADLNETSYLRKVLQYREVIEKGLYKKHFGMKAGMLVLNVTTNFQHMHHIIELVNELTGDRGSPYLLFKTMPQFGKYLRIPPVTTELLTVPWHRGKFEPFHINKGQ
jgi:hypothetical protein